MCKISNLRHILHLYHTATCLLIIILTKSERRTSVYHLYFHLLLIEAYTTYIHVVVTFITISRLSIALLLYYPRVHVGPILHVKMMKIEVCNKNVSNSNSNSNSICDSLSMICIFIDISLSLSLKSVYSGFSINIKL